MKTTFKTLLCALALSTTVAFAGPGSDAKKPASFATGIYQSNDGTLKVNIEKGAPVNATVLITNSAGKALVRKGLTKKETKAAFSFDVSALPEGEYSVQVLSKEEKEVKNFTIVSEKTVTTRTISFE